MQSEFSPDELKVSGYYDSPIPGRPSAPILASPISTKENVLLALNGEKPLWYPAAGMIGGDYKPLRPRMFPDLFVAHDVMDGEPPVDWKAQAEHLPGWFGTTWVYEWNIGGSMVVPDSQQINDMNDWEQLPFPNLDDYDWQQSSDANAVYFDSGLPIEFCIPTAYWERLMAILRVDDAAVALVDEDQQGAVHDFFEKLTDFYIDYIQRVRKYYKADIILMHDDWGHQNSPFFSYSTCKEMIIPHFKRLITAIHDQGMRFEQHCCGKSEAFVPLMIDAGVDLWIPQTMNNLQELVSNYDGQILFGHYIEPLVTPETPDNKAYQIAKELVATFGKKPVAYVNYNASMKFYEMVYELSRKALL